jgi:hypothetical protein
MIGTPTPPHHRVWRIGLLMNVAEDDPDLWKGGALTLLQTCSAGHASD